MNGYEGGDEHFMPLNMMPVGQQEKTESIPKDKLFEKNESLLN
jgi:hypothetical protein